MPNSRHTSVIVSPSNSRATNRRRSSITELAFHGIHTSRRTKAESVTHVSGTKCHLCLGPLNLDVLLDLGVTRNEPRLKFPFSLGFSLGKFPVAAAPPLTSRLFCGAVCGSWHLCDCGPIKVSLE